MLASPGLCKTIQVLKKSICIKATLLNTITEKALLMHAKLHAKLFRLKSWMNHKHKVIESATGKKN